MKKKRSRLLVLLIVLAMVFSLLPSTLAETAGTASAGSYDRNGNTIKVVVKDSSGEGLSGQTLTLSAVTNTVNGQDIVTGGLGDAVTDSSGTAAFTISYNGSRVFEKGQTCDYTLKVSTPASSEYSYSPTELTVSGAVTISRNGDGPSGRISSGSELTFSEGGGYFTAAVVPVTPEPEPEPEPEPDLTPSELSGLTKTLTQTDFPGVMDVSLTVDGMSVDTSKSANYTIVIDNSTSMTSQTISGVSRLNVVKRTLLGQLKTGATNYLSADSYQNNGVLHDIFASSPGKIKVCIVGFGVGAWYITPSASPFSSSETDCAAYIAGIVPNSTNHGTDYVGAMNQSTIALNAAPAADYNNYIFLSDGEPYNDGVLNSDNAYNACVAFAAGSGGSFRDSYTQTNYNIGSSATNAANRYSIAFAASITRDLEAISNYSYGGSAHHVIQAGNQTELDAAFEQILTDTLSLSGLTISDPLSSNVTYSNSDGTNISLGSEFTSLTQVSSGLVVQTAPVVSGAADWTKAATLDESAYTVTDTGITLLESLPAGTALKLTFPVKVEDSVYNDYFDGKGSESYLSNGDATVTGTIGDETFNGSYTSPTFTVPYTSIVVSKKDNSGSFLADAVFTLERITGYEGTSCSPAADQVSTSTADEYSVSFTNLTPGTYRLTETPPEGYESLFTELVFSLTEIPVKGAAADQAYLNSQSMSLVSLTDKDGTDVENPTLTGLTACGVTIDGVSEDETVTGSSTVSITGTIVNTPSTMSLRLTKQSGTAGTYLAGAQFMIYSDEACTTQIGSVESTDAGGDQVVATDGTTPLMLDIGTAYYIQEIKAPANQVINNTVYQITPVTAGSAIKVKDSNGVWNDVGENRLPSISNAEDNSYAAVTFANYEQMALPLTGGSSNQWHMTAGLIFFAGAGLLILRSYIMKRTGGTV